MRGEMKFSKKRNQFESANVTLDVEQGTAFSYNWWKFLAVINGKLIFNAHTYSPSTTKHQSKVRSQLDKLGVKIDLVVRTRLSLGDSDKALTDAITTLESEVKEIQDILSNNRRKKALDFQRNEVMSAKLEHIKDIGTVLAGSKLGQVLA